MNDLFNKLVGAANDAGALAKSLVDSGVKHVTTAFKGIRIFGSISAMPSENLERDETHYLLVPYPDPNDHYAVFSKRVLPPDTGITNSLPKVRIFHVPDKSGRKALEREIIDKAVEDAVGDEEGQSDFADRIEKFADMVDRETEKVSGGILLIGGAVALVNPLVGVGIAAQSIWPSLGTKASKFGASIFGDKLRARNKSKEEEKARKEAEKDVKKLKPEIFENPLIRHLDAVITNQSDDHDPLLQNKVWVEEFEDYRFFAVTIEAIAEVYEEVVGGKEDFYLDPRILKWIRHLSELDQDGAAR